MEHFTREDIEIVYAVQDEVFKAVSKLPKEAFPFVLTGGTALARFHLKHRVSYDIDFFCTLEKIRGVDFEPIKEVIVSAFESEDEFDIEEHNLIHEEEKENVLNIYRLVINTKLPSGSVFGVKVEFVDDIFALTFPHQKIPGYPNLEMVPAEGIYMRKIWATLSEKVDRVKDYIDLYFLDREVKPFVEYATEDMSRLWRQNFGEWNPARLLPALRTMSDYIAFHKEEVGHKLKNVYMTSVSADELEGWINEQIEKLKKTLSLKQRQKRWRGRGFGFSP